jgi:uncharacterized protein (TIGR04255 family)
MERVLFDNNKIVEALCQFTFKSIQDNTIFGRFWDSLKEDGIYTNKENVQAIRFSLDGDEPGITPALASAMKFTNNTQNKIIQLHNNNISIHQVKGYQKWEVFKTEIDNAFSKFNQVASNNELERIDLRAINVFDFPVSNFELNDYFNIYTVQPQNISNASLNITLEYPLDRKNTFAVLRLKTSVQPRINVVLDLSFVSMETNIQSMDTDCIYDLLQFGHDELYKLFSSVLTDKTKNIIK